MFVPVYVCVSMHNRVSVFFPGHDHTPSELSSGHHNLILPSLLSKLISALLRETGPTAAGHSEECVTALYGPSLSLLF